VDKKEGRPEAAFDLTAVRNGGLAFSSEVDTGSREENASKQESSVPLLTDDSQIGANLRVCADEENRADFDQRG
jgi:hypothetical protein